MERNTGRTKAIQTSFNILRLERTLQSRLLLRHTPQPRIQEAVRQGSAAMPHETNDMDRYTVQHFQLLPHQRTTRASIQIAKFIRLRKPNEPEYEQAGAYRSHPLLSTLGKALEIVVAE